MTPGMAEHVVVTKRAPDGLIMEFVKTEIGLPAAEYLKAKAFIETEKSKEKAHVTASNIERLGGAVQAPFREHSTTVPA